MEKNFYLMDNIGSTKYTVNFHDGEKKHKDGSPFYDMKPFKNKRIRDAFIKELHKTGYMERAS